MLWSAIASRSEGGEKEGECIQLDVFTVSQAEAGVRQDFTVRSILIDKSRDPSRLGCRPSLPNNRGLPRKVVKLSAKGTFLL